MVQPLRKLLMRVYNFVIKILLCYYGKLEFSVSHLATSALFFLKKEEFKFRLIYIMHNYWQLTL